MNEYDKQADDFMTKTGTKMTVKWLRYAPYFPDDKEPKNIYAITLHRANHAFTFKYGQSIAAGRADPRPYGVLACIKKSDPGTFEDFCSAFGYDIDSKKAEKVYEAVKLQWLNIERLFSDEEISLLQEIA